MPLQESDVLNTLSDSVTLNMNFWVAAVHIDGRSYGIIRDHIRAGNILVVEGNETLAKYDQKTEALVGLRGDGGTSHDQSRDESAKESFASAAGVVHELEEAEIERQLLLRDAPVWPQPGA